MKDPKYLDYIRSLPCHLCGWESSWGHCDPHHVGNGVDVKRHRDDLTVPLCRHCHELVEKKPSVYRDKMREVAAKYREQWMMKKH